jgi:hypothetical protein
MSGQIYTGGKNMKIDLGVTPQSKQQEQLYNIARACIRQQAYRFKACFIKDKQGKHTPRCSSCPLNTYDLGYAPDEVKLIFRSALADHYKFGMWDLENRTVDKQMLLWLSPLIIGLLLLGLFNL